MDRHVTLLNLLAGIGAGAEPGRSLPMGPDADFQRLLAAIPPAIWAEAA